MKGRVVMAAAFFGLSVPMAGAAGRPQLVVTQAVIHIDQDNMTIYGTNFLNKGDEQVRVWLAETELALLLPPLPTEILVALPAGLAAGAYLLTVSRGPATTENDTFAWTFGPTGPPGPEGPTGPQGDMGPQGHRTDGPPGASGRGRPHGPAGRGGLAGCTGWTDVQSQWANGLSRGGTRHIRRNPDSGALSPVILPSAPRVPCSAVPTSTATEHATPGWSATPFSRSMIQVPGTRQGLSAFVETRHRADSA